MTCTRTRALFIVALLVASPAARAASRVVVIEDNARGTREATARLRAELAAAGFEVESRVARDAEGRRDVEGDESSVATVRLTRDAATRGAELWVSDRLTGKTLVRRVNADPEKAPRLVAIRGVELLRASLLELTSPPHDDAPPATPALARPAPPEVQALVGPPPAPLTPPPAEKPTPLPPPVRGWRDRFAIDAGAALLASTEGLGASFAPTVGARVPLPLHLALRPRVVGPAFRSGVTNAAGTADTRQEMASVEVAWSPIDGPLVPFVAVGGGAYHLHVEGTAIPPYHGASDEVWSALVSAGLGVDVKLASGIGIAIEGHAIALTPHPVVAIGGVRVAAAGAPTVLGSVALVAAF